jgi:hypothetical protein
MAQVLPMNTADIMALPQQRPIYLFSHPSAFLRYDEPTIPFPTYQEPTEIMADVAQPHPINKLVADVSRTPGRQPSPQPTHFSVPPAMSRTGSGQSGHSGHSLSNGGGHRVLRSATLGYIAPEFAGKKEQQEQGKL